MVLHTGGLLIVAWAFSFTCLRIEVEGAVVILLIDWQKHVRKVLYVN